MDEELASYVHTVMISLPISQDKLSQVHDQTAASSLLSEVKYYIENGSPENKNSISKNLQEYWTIRHELTSIEGIIMKNNRIVIPESLQGEILETKYRARILVFWPGMNKEIEDMVKRCSACMEFRFNNQKVTLMPKPMPEWPWQVVGTDLFQLENIDYLIITDYYSRFFKVAKVENTKNVTVIQHLKSIFARHGIPFEVKSDNGSQFSSREFKDFSNKWCFIQTTSNPHFPQTNGLAGKKQQYRQ